MYPHHFLTFGIYSEQTGNVSHIVQLTTHQTIGGYDSRPPTSQIHYLARYIILPLPVVLLHQRIINPFY